MKTGEIICCLLIFLGINAYSQENPDSLSNDTVLEEIIIEVNQKTLEENQAKSLSTLDEYLEKSSKINMIKRGGYAWEPMINNMATERTVITIDGMRIFGACTDKMDPITSYVEISNLSKAEVISGQQGNAHGATIGGSLDLKRNTIHNQKQGWKSRIISGYETNNQQKILGVLSDIMTNGFMLRQILPIAMPKIIKQEKTVKFFFRNLPNTMFLERLAIF